MHISALSGIGAFGLDRKMKHANLRASRRKPVKRHTLCCLLARYLVVKEPQLPAGASRLEVWPWHPGRLGGPDVGLHPIATSAAIRQRTRVSEEGTIASPDSRVKESHEAQKAALSHLQHLASEHRSIDFLVGDPGLPHPDRPLGQQSASL
jgi:hypothetical protein